MAEVRSNIDAQAQKISVLEAEVLELKEEKKTQQEAFIQLAKLQTQVGDLEYENYISKPWAIKDPNHYERPFRGIHWK